MKRRSIADPLLLSALWVALLGASGQPATTATPGPSMMRVSYVSGDVSIVRRNEKGELTTVAASVNDPLQAGDSIATGKTGRSELQLDGTTTLRLAENAKLQIASDGAKERRLELERGMAVLSLVRGTALQDAVVLTPALTMRTNYAGDYRLDADAGTVSVRSGQASIETPHGTTSALAEKPAAPDDFDRFNAERDRVALDALAGAGKYVPADLAGYNDLTQYGKWQDVANYGHVWVPQENAAASWAPYRSGQWVWQKNYGWTWVGSEPWGWVPYHYGRWVYVTGTGWGWYPPAFGTTVVWVPAMVGFFGITPAFGTCGGMGWVPLAPGEPYYAWNYPYPWYPPQYYYNCSHPAYPIGLSRHYANLRYGGASTATAQAWHSGNFAHTIVPYKPVQIVPQPRATLPPPQPVRYRPPA